MTMQTCADVRERVLAIGRQGQHLEGLLAPLRGAGFECAFAADGDSGLNLVDSFAPAAVLCESDPAGVDGVVVLERIRAVHPSMPVLLVLGPERAEELLHAFRRGATDCLLAPVRAEDVVARCRSAIKARAEGRDTDRRRRETSATRTTHGMVGASPSMREVFELIGRVAASRANVLVLGEGGTGKELVAHAIHAASPMREGPFVALNCAALSEHLLESELFGHMKGAFTGAHCDRAGYFEVASGGTLFLDEISELPLSLQPKLLRAIEQHEVVRVGGTRPVPVDARLVAAANRDLKTECDQRRFREDLYARLNVVQIRIPPLRERKEDIPLIVSQAIARYAQEMGKAIGDADRDAMRFLVQYDWPGNVRELENAIERAMIVGKGTSITAADLPAEVRGAESAEAPTTDLRRAMRRYESEHIRMVLWETGGNREEAARRLGINPSTLYRKMDELEIHAASPRGRKERATGLSPQ